MFTLTTCFVTNKFGNLYVVVVGMSFDIYYCSRFADLPYISSYKAIINLDQMVQEQSRL